jgi:hypothetical protein
MGQGAVDCGQGADMAVDVGPAQRIAAMLAGNRQAQQAGIAQQGFFRCRMAALAVARDGGFSRVPSTSLK